jgi:hypothetical protein
MSDEKTQEKTVFKSVMEFMQQRFTGNMETTVAETMKYVHKNKLASGPLWDEIGAQTLRKFFAETLRHNRNNLSAGVSTKLYNHVAHALAPQVKEAGREAMVHMSNQHQIAPSRTFERIYWYQYGNEWIDVAHFTKADCIGKAQKYQKLAEGNASRQNFFTELASMLNDTQIVKDVLPKDEYDALFNKYTKGKGEA